VIGDGFAGHSEQPEPIPRRRRNLLEPTPGREENLRDDVVGFVRRDAAPDVPGNRLIVSGVPG
jgi:hypothetical protein